MRKFPESVIIFGEEYKVIIENIKTGELGLADPNNKTITLEKNQSEKSKTHSFIHEFGHCVIFRTGLFQGIDEKMIEVVVESMATALLENFTIINK
jgi:Zn-dependent peptidase ImmA (M78 family)